MYKIPAITLFIGKNLKYVPECPSTNDLMQLICQKEQLSEGTLVITSSQFAGRGQRGNSWETESGMNLTFSIFLKPVFLPMAKQFLLNIVASLGVLDFLTKVTDKRIQIKWPNDILLDERKVGGILIENQVVGQNISSSVVGIGLNINQQNFSLPNATSLGIATGQQFELQNCLDTLLLCLEYRYLQLREQKYDYLQRDYLNNLFRINELHTFSDTGGVFRGTITGIDEIGKLRIHARGKELTFDIKEIKFDGW